jgi:hypothetical protein
VEKLWHILGFETLHTSITTHQQSGQWERQFLNSLRNMCTQDSTNCWS